MPPILPNLLATRRLSTILQRDEENVFKCQVDLAKRSRKLVDNFQSCGKDGKAIAKPLAEFTCAVLEFGDTQEVESALEYMKWLDKHTDVDGEDEETPLPISIKDIIDLFFKMRTMGKSSGLSPLLKNFDGTDARVGDLSSGKIVEVAAGANYKLHRGAIFSGGIPSMGGKPLLLSAQDSSQGQIPSNFDACRGALTLNVFQREFRR